MKNGLSLKTLTDHIFSVSGDILHPEIFNLSDKIYSFTSSLLLFVLLLLLLLILLVVVVLLLQYLLKLCLLSNDIL